MMLGIQVHVRPLCYQKKYATMAVLDFGTMPTMHRTHQGQMSYTHVPQHTCMQTMGEVLEVVGGLA